MPHVRKTFIGVLAALGASYVALGAWTLLNLHDVTARWTYLSGDPDFPADAPIFSMWLAAGLLAVVLLGLGTVASSVWSLRRTAWQPRWIALAVAAPLIHFVWFMYRMIGTGRLPRSVASAELRLFAIRCLVICAAYVLAAVWLRRGSIGPARELV